MSEVEEILHTLLNFRDPWSQLDEAKTKLTNLIAQEANKARLEGNNAYRELVLGWAKSFHPELLNELQVLTADKEQADDKV